MAPLMLSASTLEPKERFGIDKILSNIVLYLFDM